jgi:hypothetical protein
MSVSCHSGTHVVQQKRESITSSARRRAFETGLRRACLDLSDGGALGFTFRSGARIQLDLILPLHDSREMSRSANRFRRSGCRLCSAHMKEAGDAPASSLVIPCGLGLDHVFCRATDGKPRPRV